MKVVHLISGLFWGGGQKVVSDLLSNTSPLLDQGVVLLGNEVEQRFGQNVIESLEYNGQYNSVNVVSRLARRLRRIVLESGCEILHSHGVDADLIASLAVLGTKVGHVVHLHLTDDDSIRKSWKQRARARIIGFCCRRSRTGLVAVSDAVARDASAFATGCGKQPTVVRNAVSLVSTMRDDRGGLPRRTIIASAGRLTPKKGFKTLISSATKLRGDFEIRIAGSGRQREELEGHVADLGLGDRVKFLGHLEDLERLYLTADAFVLPSEKEGLPLVVLEAMASGLPVVATDVGGTKEVIVNSSLGILVPPRDEQALTQALQTLVDDPEKRLSMGSKARQFVREHFSINRLHAEIEAVYRKLVD